MVADTDAYSRVGEDDELMHLLGPKNAEAGSIIRLWPATHQAILRDDVSIMAGDLPGAVGLYE